MKTFNYLIATTIAVLCLASCSKDKAAVPSKISIDMSQKGVEVPEGLWGIFYEEINRAGDGGL